MDDEWIRMVARHARGKATTVEVQEVEAPANLDRWRAGLVSILKDLQAQFASRKADAEEAHDEINTRDEWLAYRRDYDRWRSSAIGFQRHIERRLADVKQRLRDRHQERAERLSLVSVDDPDGILRALLGLATRYAKLRYELGNPFADEEHAVIDVARAYLTRHAEAPA